MTKEEIESLKLADTDGLHIYEYIANNIGNCDEDLTALAEALREIDLTGQFTASAARFLHAIDSRQYADAVRLLVAATIDRDRERSYLPELMQCIYGPDCEARAAELSATDNNFRRMYKRIYPDSAM